MILSKHLAVFFCLMAPAFAAGPQVTSKLDKVWKQEQTPVYQAAGEDAVWVGAWQRSDAKALELFIVNARKGAVAKSLSGVKDEDLLKSADRSEQAEIAQGVGVKAIARTGFVRVSPEQFNTYSFVEYKDGRKITRLQAMKTVPSKKQFFTYVWEVPVKGLQKVTKDQEKQFEKLCDSVEVKL